MPTAAVPETGTFTVRKDERFYRPELDCLRFFAFFAVYVYHMVDATPAYFAAHHVPFPTLVAGAASAGRFGVDLFFLLSAYLITELLLREWERYGKLDLRAFYVRRILRIWPLYFLALLIGVLLPLVDSREYFPVSYALAFAGLVGNWLVLGHVRIQSVIWPLWSVSMEEQFYLLWPAFISRSGRRRTLLYAAAALLMIAELSRLLLAGYARALHSQAPISTFTLTRLDPLTLGIASALLLWKRQYHLKWGWRLGSLLTGCGLWLVAGCFYSITRNFLLFGYPAIALGAWFIFFSALGAPWAPRWLRYLGKISYGLYVFHMLAIRFALDLLGGSVHTLRGYIVYWCLGLLLTLVLAALSYRFYESPFLRLKERFTRVRSRPV